MTQPQTWKEFSTTKKKATLINLLTKHAPTISPEECQTIADHQWELFEDGGEETIAENSPLIDLLDLSGRSVLVYYYEPDQVEKFAEAAVIVNHRIAYPEGFELTEQTANVPFGDIELGYSTKDVKWSDDNEKLEEILEDISPDFNLHTNQCVVVREHYTSDLDDYVQATRWIFHCFIPNS